MRASVQRTSKGRHPRQGVAAFSLFVCACSWLFACLFVGAASTADTEYTVKGSVSGHFAALASKSPATGGRDIQFKFTWTGEQTPEGADAKTQAGITCTVKYKPPRLGRTTRRRLNPRTPPIRGRERSRRPASMERSLADSESSAWLRVCVQFVRNATETSSAISEHQGACGALNLWSVPRRRLVLVHPQVDDTPECGYTDSRCFKHLWAKGSKSKRMGADK